MRYAEASYSAEGGASRQPVISNSVLGVLVFIFTEVMFFAGLISAFLISKANAGAWPPLGQPRLPVEATGFNSLVLLASAVTVYLAGRSFRREGYSKRSERLFLFTLGLGSFFVIFQGIEWARLIGFGLTMQSGAYGSFFYLVIGTHALHAVGALAAMLRLFFLMRRRKLKDGSFAAGQIFWYFVVAVWPLLYVLVYLP